MFVYYHENIFNFFGPDECIFLPTGNEINILQLLCENNS